MFNIALLSLKWGLGVVQIDGKQIFDSGRSSRSSAGLPLWCVCSGRGGELQELSRLF